MSNITERAQVVKAMDKMIYCINREDFMDAWFMSGVANGDNISNNTTAQEIIDMGYCDDKTFSELMTLFLKLMRKAGMSGGLFCDGIVSGHMETTWTEGA